MAGFTDALPMPAKPFAAPAPSSSAAWLALLREWIALGLIVWLADATIFFAQGFAGLAVFVAAVPVLLLLGKNQPCLAPRVGVLGLLSLLLAARLLWQGSGLAVACGGAWLLAFALALHGRRIDVLDWLAGCAQLAVAGLAGMVHYHDVVSRKSPPVSAVMLCSVFLPAAVVLLFGALFILANPDLTHSFAQTIERGWEMLEHGLQRLADDWPRFAFWLVAAYVAIGLLRPVLARVEPTAAALAGAMDAEVVAPPRRATLFVSLRNTLLAVIALFTVYLAYEFSTLWFRKFPPGFYYAGYAHQGAAWLTTALALATLTLSLIFRGPVLHDPRIGQLRWLAWIWSAQNLILALTVYHRLCIYIDFNGLSRMRMIGLFGISTVVVGFLLVLLKIVHGRDFGWLVQRQLLALAAAFLLFALTPVDAIVQAYNVRQIRAGDLAPAVQISVHPISAEGYLMLWPLVDCDDPTIRAGIRALLAQQGLDAEQRAANRPRAGWTAYQISDELLREQLRGNRLLWREYRDDARRASALQQFHDYAYQWY